MPSNLIRLLQIAARRSPEPAALQNTLLQVALDEPWDSYAEIALKDLIEHATLDARQRELLLWCSNDGVSKAAWEKFGPEMTLEQWGAIDRHVSWTDIRRIQLAAAPLRQMSTTAIATLLGANLDQLDVPAATRIVETWFYDGMEELWPQALRVLHPAEVHKDVVDAAVGPLVDGKVDVHADSSCAPLYRLASAVAPTAPAGTIARLLNEVPDLPEQMGEKFRDDYATDWRQTLFCAPVGRLVDMLAFIEIERHFGIAKELTALEEAFFNADVAEQYKATMAIARSHLGSSEREELTRIARATWDRIPLGDRTDTLCANVLGDLESGPELHQVALDHLGDRARDVAEAHGLLDADSMPVRNLLRWVGEIAIDRWIQQARTSTLTLNDIPEHVIAAAVDDLLANPAAWKVQPAKVVAKAAEFGPAEWSKLTTPQVVYAAESNPAAADWVLEVLTGQAEVLLDPVRMHAGRLIADTQTPVEDVLGAIRGLN